MQAVFRICMILAHLTLSGLCEGTEVGVLLRDIIHTADELTVGGTLLVFSIASIGTA